MNIIGIDTGTKTGFCHLYNGEICQLKTYNIIKAQAEVLHIHQSQKDIVIAIEDTRKRKWVTDDIGNERLKGVGSVNRDSAIWQEFCEFYDIAYLLIAPAYLIGLLKMPVNDFTLFSGWQGKSSEHSRDAFVLADKVNKLIIKGYLQIPLKPSEVKRLKKNERKGANK